MNDSDLRVPTSVNLADLIDEADESLEMNLMQRTDGRFLARADSTIFLGGVPGAGKTTLAMHTARGLARTDPVWFFSYETSGRNAALKFRELGGLGEAGTVNLVYFDNPPHAAALPELLRVNPPAHVFVDKLGDCMAHHGADLRIDRDVATFVRDYIKPFREAGTGVLFTMHPTKRRGSIAGAPALEGAADLILELRTKAKPHPGGPGRPARAGESTLYVRRDRYIASAALADGDDRLAVVRFIPGADRRLDVIIDPPPHQVRTPEAEQPLDLADATGLMLAVSQAIERSPHGLSITALRKAVRASAGSAANDRIGEALDALRERGFVTERQGPRQGRVHVSTKPYDPAATLPDIATTDLHARCDARAAADPAAPAPSPFTRGEGGGGASGKVSAGGKPDPVEVGP